VSRGRLLACLRDMAGSSTTAAVRERRAAVDDPHADGRRERRWSPGLVLITVAAFAVTAWFTSQVTEWLVMTDEMQYVKLALGIAREHQVLPHLHDIRVQVYSQLYPLLLAPIVGAFDMPTAFRIAHYLNALLMASAAIPTYLLVRGLPAARGPALIAAGLSVAVPYMAMSLMLMTEVPGYPAFLWALLAMHRAMVAPSPKRDLLAIGGIALAVLARTQYMLLVIAYPAAVVVHELGYALARRDGRGAALRAAVRDAGRRHVVLWGAVAVGAVAAVLLALAGRLSSALGSYRATATGDLLPPGLVDSAIRHADLVFVAGGVIPAVLGLGWALSTLLLPSLKSLHAYAVLALVVGIGMLVQVTSFDLRFVGGFLQTRYLTALPALLIVATIACCLDPRRRWIGVIVAAVALSRVLPWLPYTPAPSPWFGAPDTAFHIVLYGRTQQVTGWFGIHDVGVPDLLRWGTPILGLVLALALRAAPRRAFLAAVAVVLIPYGVAQTVYVLNKMTVGPNGARLVSGTSLDGRDWIDRAVPDGASVAIVPVPVAAAPVPADGLAYYSQTLWWDTEFWNKSVNQAYRRTGADSFTDWPKPYLTIDREAGRLVVGGHRPYLVVSASQMDFRPRARRVVAHTNVLDLIEVDPSYALDWSTQGIGDTGVVGTGWSLRVYGDPDLPTGRRVGFDAVATGDLQRPARVVLRSGGARTVATIAPGASAAPRLDICVPAGGHTDVTAELRGGPGVRLIKVVSEPGDGPARGC
jgi:hypothetical protein